MKKIVFLILTVVLLSGCTMFSKPVKIPDVTIIVDGKRYAMIPHDFEWAKGNTEIRSLGTSTIQQLADGFETIDTKKSAIINFELEKDPTTLQISRINEDGTITEIKHKDDQITMPDEAGYYIYELKVTWPNGKSTFVFDVDVK